MATENFTVKIPVDKFDAATLRLSGAKALVSTLQIFIGDTEDGEMPVTNNLLAEALYGIRLLLEEVDNNLTVDMGKS